MFQESLLESSPMLRKRNRWSMATGFTLQMAVAAMVVVIPLLSSGVLPLSSRLTLPPTIFTPVAPVQHLAASGNAGSAGPVLRAQVVDVFTNTHGLTDPFRRATSSPDSNTVRPDLSLGDRNGPPSNVIEGGRYVPPPPRPAGPIRISQPSEALLLNKVVPVYPKVASIAGVQGDVKLHAMIGRGGDIKALSVISGHPLLTRAALDAVSQWRYKPFTLNGEPIEVDTYITVTFKRSQ